jgi:hypothetical protein
LIPSGTNATYKLKVAGTSYFTKPIISTLTPSSWIDGQRYVNGAFSIADYSNTSSYNPWMRATNTWTSGAESAKVGRWFSFGTLGTSFYWMGSVTTRTDNSYDYALRYDTANGYLYASAFKGNADTATSAGKWTTARTLTIGNKGQSVDGSGNVSWSLADIGAAPASTVSCTTANVESALGIDFITNTGALNSNGWKTLGGRSSDAKIAISYASSSPATWNSSAYSASLVFGCNDTKGLLDLAYNTPVVTFGGASVSGSTDNDPKWYFKLSGTSGKTYTFPSDSKTLAAADGSNASGTWGISITGSAGSVAWANTGHPSTFPPTIGTTSTTAAAGDHTHTISLT